MYYFCTYFDQGYLVRGLALYHSLRQHCPDFQLWILCLDEPCYNTLDALDLPGVMLIAMADFERDDAALQQARSNRSRIEYYFTCTPSLPLYILDHRSEIDLITYLDADLYFFANPQPLFTAISHHDLAVTPHRFAPRVRRLAKLGRYNVGWVSFRRSTSGLACLHWWREQCLEWCYDRYESDRFADQKYLDQWPARFAGLVELDQKGANLAPWNLATYTISAQGERVMVDAEPLYFYHFHAFRRPSYRLYDHQLHLYRHRPQAHELRLIYFPYIHALAEVQRTYGLAQTSVHQRPFRRQQSSVPLDLIFGLLSRRYIMRVAERLVAYDRWLRPSDLGPAPAE